MKRTYPEKWSLLYYKDFINFLSLQKSQNFQEKLSFTTPSIYKTLLCNA